MLAHRLVGRGDAVQIQVSVDLVDQRFHRFGTLGLEPRFDVGQPAPHLGRDRAARQALGQVLSHVLESNLHLQPVDEGEHGRRLIVDVNPAIVRNVFFVLDDHQVTDFECEVLQVSAVVGEGLAPEEVLESVDHVLDAVLGRLRLAQPLSEDVAERAPAEQSHVLLDEAQVGFELLDQLLQEEHVVDHPLVDAQVVVFGLLDAPLTGSEHGLRRSAVHSTQGVHPEVEVLIVHLRLDDDEQAILHLLDGSVVDLLQALQYVLQPVPPRTGFTLPGVLSEQLDHLAAHAHDLVPSLLERGALDQHLLRDLPELANRVVRILQGHERSIGGTPIEDLRRPVEGDVAARAGQHTDSTRLAAHLDGVAQPGPEQGHAEPRLARGDVPRDEFFAQ